MRGERASVAALVCLASATIASCARGVEGGFTPEGSPNLLGDGGIACNSGISCRQVECVKRGLPETTVTGIVNDPSGTRPLYNVFVYVPSTTPEPIIPGHPTCDPCQAPASGSPLVYTSTDALGRFRLEHVPTGDNVPLVMQVGKWRRQVVIPRVEACTETTMLDPSVMHMPSKASEGDMPLIALATGCDAAECFLRSVGIDDAEFTGPAGGGHVHVYGGRYAGMSIPHMGDAYSLWATPGRLETYDIVLAACECLPYSRDTEGPAYAAMHEYMDHGGRLYTTHYHSNWFSPPSGPLDFQQMAQWIEGSESYVYETYFVETSFPKGRAFADWLDQNALSPAYGEVVLTDTRDSVQNVTGATRWIYGAQERGDAQYYSKYLSFNTPIGAPVTSQCGRATFSDVHLSGVTPIPGAFPEECSARVDPHGINETALEFLFFDLVSCIQDDTKPPQPPTEK
jgi:hypothetical protein